MGVMSHGQDIALCVLFLVSPAARHISGQVISVDGGTSDSLRGSLPNPALEVMGCTTSQADVAKVISSLRRVDGVERVSLSSSQKLDQGSPSAGGSGSGGDAGGDCRYGNSHYPQFSMTLFFATPTTPSAAQTASATTTP